MGPHPFERLFAPRAVAVLGAEGAGSTGARFLENLVAAGFPGTLHAVAPLAAPAGAHACGSLAGIEGPLDLAVLARPAAELRALVCACGARGVAAAVIPPPEPGQAGPDAALARALRDEAARSGLRLLGPGSLGLLRPEARLDATFSSTPALPGSLALVSQSGAVCTTVLDWAAAHRIGFSAVASLGEAVDVDFGDVLEYLAFDERTRSVLLHVEHLRSARGFLSGLRLAARRKPVVVVKAGRHPATAADPGAPVPSSDETFDAALLRAGAVRVASIEQLFAAAQLLGTGTKVAGSRLAIVTNARGPGLLAADRAFDLGITLPPPGAAARRRLDALLPPAGARGNPLDLLGDAGPDRYRAAVESCRADPEVDGVLALLAPQARSRPLETAEAVVEVGRGPGKPLLACWMGEERVRAARAHFLGAGLPHFSTPEGAVEAFFHLASHARSQRLLRQAAGPVAPEAVPLLDQARDAVQGALANGRGPLTTAEVKKLLGAFGVRLEPAPGHRVRGAELHVSVARDGTFGPVIRFGLGGAGRAPDRIVALPPLDTAVVRTLVASSRLAGALSRALSAEELAALERTLWALSEVVCEVPELRDLELDPLVPVRGALLALAARATVAAAEPGPRPYGHLAIHPYPRHVGARFALRDGTRVVVRPIRPEDAAMEARFVRELSPTTKYFRFMVPIRELDLEALVRFTQLDYDRELALVAVVEREGEEEEIAVARYVLLPDGRSAELAIVVADAWQRRGLGGRLLGMLVDVARARGVPRLEGEVLAENAASRAMLRRLGFTLRRHPEGPQTLIFEKVLAPV